jgi:hypothetical protein
MEMGWCALLLADAALIFVLSYYYSSAKGITQRVGLFIH